MISKMPTFFLKRISIKFDVDKLTKIIALGYIIVEKIVVKLNKLLMIYVEFYKNMVENEINMANITKDDKVLHFGCGSIPATCILIAKKTGAQITGIDNNSNTIKEAFHCLSKFEDLDNINIKYGEVFNFPIETFDIILFSQGVEPRIEVLKHIAQSMKEGGRVVLRIILSSRLDLTKNDKSLNSLFSIDKMIFQVQYGLLVSVLLLKKQKNTISNTNVRN